MAFNKVLVAYDGSDFAKKALEEAKDLAELSPNVHIDIVNVVPIPMLGGMDIENLQDIIDMMMDDGKQTLLEAQDIMADVSNQISTFLLKGTSPAMEILKMIDADGYDLVIIGRRGLSGIREYFGSVSYKILHESEIPVLVVKE